MNSFLFVLEYGKIGGFQWLWSVWPVHTVRLYFPSVGGTSGCRLSQYMTALLRAHSILRIKWCLSLPTQKESQYWTSVLPKCGMFSGLASVVDPQSNMLLNSLFHLKQWLSCILATWLPWHLYFPERKCDAFSPPSWGRCGLRGSDSSLRTLLLARSGQRQRSSPTPARQPCGGSASQMPSHLAGRAEHD